mmetsp:Transcript_17638/g.30380  ORF Transcript_17638/g.30380 Transcript_17638/m.30380 type:complete len:132 (+) Transcript_17638:719-1114(+)
MWLFLFLKPAAAVQKGRVWIPFLTGDGCDSSGSLDAVCFDSSPRCIQGRTGYLEELERELALLLAGNRLLGQRVWPFPLISSFCFRTFPEFDDFSCFSDSYQSVHGSVRQHVRAIIIFHVIYAFANALFVT